MLITANDHGTRQMCGTDKYGFPNRHRTNKQIHFGFQNGDIIKAVVKSGKKVGEYAGRVLCRATGSFDIATKAGKISGISHKYCLATHKRMDTVMLFETNLTAIKIACALPPCLFAQRVEDKSGASTARGVW